MRRIVVGLVVLVAMVAFAGCTSNRPPRTPTRVPETTVDVVTAAQQIGQRTAVLFTPTCTDRVDTLVYLKSECFYKADLVEARARELGIPPERWPELTMGRDVIVDGQRIDATAVTVPTVFRIAIDPRAIPELHEKFKQPVEAALYNQQIVVRGQVMLADGWPQINVITSEQVDLAPRRR